MKENPKAMDTTLNHNGANPSLVAPDIVEGALPAIPAGSRPPHPTGIKDETWRTLKLWRFLADKKEECTGCGQEWIWESRRWSPLFLKKHEELNLWCKDNYELAVDGSVKNWQLSSRIFVCRNYAHFTHSGSGLALRNGLDFL